MSWRGLDHRTIYEMVVNGGQGIGVSDPAEVSWNAANQAVLDAERDIGAALNASQAEWEGVGADAMRTAYSPLGQWAVNAATSAARTAGGVGDQAVIAMETQRLVADNAPPQNFFEYLHDQVGSWDGHTIYDEQAATVDRLMVGYEQSSVANEERFDTWSVPPTVVVTPAAAAPSGPGGPGGGGVGGMPQTGGLGPADGSGIASALAPGGGAGAAGAGAAGAGGAALPGGAGSPAAGGATPAGAAPAGGAGVLPGAVGSPAGGSGGTTGAGGAGTGRAPGAAGGVGPGMPGSGPGAPGAGTGAAGAGRPGAGGAGTATGGRGLGTGGVAHPSQRPLGSAGGSGTGPGPWSRAGTDAGRSPAGATPLRPVVPTAPPRTSTPDWRSVLLPPEREASASIRTPGETAARSAGPGAPGGPAATQAAAQGSGARGAGSPGMHAPMMGGGGAGAQPEGRRRASYLIDDSDAFVDKRWFTEPVITPDDPL